MKNRMKTIYALALAVVAGALFSCEEDPFEVDLGNDSIPEISAYVPEEFSNLTVVQVEELETPFEDVMALLEAANAKAFEVSEEDLIDAIRELFDGATLLDFSLDEERGLGVYKIKFLLSNGIVLKISIVQEIYEILSIEAIGDISDLDIDPQGSFISLSEAIARFEEHFDGEIVRVELSLEEDDRWEFEIHVETSEGRLEVEVDAFTGEIIAVKSIEGEDKEEFEEEEKDERPEVPESIIAAVSNHIEADVIHGVVKTYEEIDYWKVTVLTASEAHVNLWFVAENAEFVGAGDEEGPFDYEFVFGEGLMPLSEAIEVVVNELQIEVISWDFEQLWQSEIYAIRIKGETEEGVNHYVEINAANGEWIDHEVEGEEEKEEEEPELPENIEEAVSWYIEATIVHYERVVEGDRVYWEIKVETESDAKVYLLITEDSEDLVAAWDNDGPFDYEVEFGGEEWTTLSEAIFEVEEQMQAETVGWEYERVVVEEVEYWAVKIKVVNPNEVQYVIYIDVVTGTWIKEEVQD